MAAPFATTNRHLAFALLLAGCEMADHTEDGPAINTYTIGFLRQERFRSRVQGLDIEEAAKKLLNAKVPGVVSWLFVRNSIFEEAIKAWNEMADEVTKARHEGVAPQVPAVSAADTMRVLYIAQRKETDEFFDKLAFMNAGRQLVSTMEGSSKAREDGGNTITGAGQVWTIGAKDVRKHMKV